METNNDFGKYPKVFRCSAAQPPSYGWTDNTTTKVLSYGQNCAAYSKWAKMFKLTSPSTLVLLTDIETRVSTYAFVCYPPDPDNYYHWKNTSAANTNWAVASWHSTGTNIAWLDGHVSYMTEDALWNLGVDYFIRK